MSALPRRLLGNVAVQALGACATFVVGLAIALLQGPQAQGQFGLVRTTADLLVALALFGLPQSMVHAIHQGGTSPSALQRLSLRYAAALLAIAALAGMAGVTATEEARSVGGRIAWLALLVGSVGWVLQGMLRVLVLCRASALQFAWASVTPSLTLLLAVGCLLLAGSSRFEFALAASGLSSAAFTAWQLRAPRAAPAWREGLPARLLPLMRDGGHAFTQTLGLALQPWITLRLMQWHGADAVALGQFVLAAYVYQAFALPASFVSPLLFARMSEAVGAGRRYAAGRLVGAIIGATIAAALLGALLMPILVPALFGSRYAAAVPPAVVLALTGPFLVVNRLGVAMLFGQGRFRAASVHALVRVLAVPLGLAAAWQIGAMGDVTGAAVAWLLAEGVGAVALAVFWKTAAGSGR